MDGAAVLRKIEQVWNEFQAAYAGLDEADLLLPGVTGDWSVRDIIAHVTGWEEEALKYLPVIHAGEKPPRYADMYGGIDAFNAMMSKKKRDLSLAEVLREQEETHRKLVDLVRATPDEEFVRETRFRRRLRFDTYRHYGEHTASIKRWRARRDG